MLDLAVLDLLKFRLLADGVHVHPSAAGTWRELYGGPLTLGEYATTAGIGLLLPGDRYVNAPLTAEAHDQRSYVLRQGTDGFFLVHRADEPVPVEVMPVATFHDDEVIDVFDGQVRPMRSYGVTHTDRCRVSPIAGCAWKCRFCDLPYELTYRKKHADNLLKVIIAAEKDPLTPARHVLVSGGTPRGGRAGESDEDWIDSVYCDLAERSPLPLEIMMAPRRDHTHPERMRQAGVSGLSINFEISDPQRAARITPQKAQYGRTAFLRYIERAVEVFEPFAIQSLIVFGAAIEPLESTLEGVRDLAERGCVPVLSPFRPHPITPMADAPAATFDEIIEVYRRSFAICERAGTGVLPGPRCVPCHHNTIAVPVDVPFYLSSQQEGFRVACGTS
jgi:Radical SAM superfamily